ncbi:uncharacterized protein GGS22DRAFT_182426 [Annulohypoxylon maeteangense]|uniref:uncharacterized protein n=1 Tax=Annulohypoxylon maeteangense TaxID=1927788 RepID=UPI00200775DD|nr:uncharacterized protein GGS22DRAFT_182426 [Annulohypoxylon maeteangense]KAI0880336.1 hypothetical protein GGS22DRAFT_182426 [Annulohypoxylon maeteangense]
MDDDEIAIIIGVILVVLAILCVVSRFYARYNTKAGFEWDDWLILLALIVIIITDILVLVASSVDPNGAVVASNADPSYEFTPEDIWFTKVNYIATILYYTIISATKLSILLMYRRLFSANHSFRRQVLILSLLVVGFWMGCTAADLLDCVPIEWTWNNALTDPRYCFNYNIFWLATGIVEALIDVLILAMPIRLVVGLQMNTSKKIAVAAVFLLGLFVILSGLVKVAFSYVPGSRNPSFSKTEVWTTVHCCTGVICACLPICWTLFSGFARPRLGSWLAISSIRKRWYGFSGWSSVDRTAPRGSTLELERSIGLSPRDYDLPR